MTLKMLFALKSNMSVIKELCLSFQQQHGTLEALIYERIDDRYPDIAEDDVYQHLMALNVRWCCTGPNVIVNKHDWNKFYKRKEAKPIQDFPWLQIRDVPGIGRGVFAKVAIEKNAVVSDYRGNATSYDYADEILSKMSQKKREFFGLYMVEYSQDRDTRPVVQPHWHHANLKLEKTIHTCFAKKQNQEGVVLLRATRDIKVGEQLLWDYGSMYRGAKLRKDCICSACDPVLTAGSTTDLCEKIGSSADLEESVRYQTNSQMPQQISRQRQEPQSTRRRLLYVAATANAAGLVASLDGYSSADEAYKQGRAFISGTQEPIVKLLKS
ncbi:hypothetical protein Y032_0238g3286 [Ancylostoma ceylanicum]|uniref:SET domain-containing protein n=2 Tax=Ancylostoma ceylanicum TaxID=53326 RepID=A0A016SE63_9BILA|nr:hypothetical protein Y032_0238g3286 [Ancylostoma ceylanicum]